MMHFYKEGELLHQGLNIYHPKDDNSAGCIFRIDNHIWRLRYSKFSRKWHWGYFKADPKAHEALLNGETK